MPSAAAPRDGDGDPSPRAAGAEPDPDPDDPAVRTEATRDRATLAGDVEGLDASATLVLMRQADFRPAAGFRCRVTALAGDGSAAAARDLVASPEGAVSIAPGRYRIASLEPRQHFDRGVIDVARGATDILWIRTIQDLRVQVVDERGRPVEGANVACRAYDIDAAPRYRPDAAMETRMRATTDADGRAVLRDVPLPSVDLHVSSPTHLALSQTLLQPVDEVTVTLRTVEEGPTLIVTNAIDDAPVADAYAFDASGPWPLRSLGLGSFQLGRPGGPDEPPRVQLWIGAPGHGTAEIVLEPDRWAAATTIDVELAPSATVTLRFVDVEPPALVWVDDDSSVPEWTRIESGSTAELRVRPQGSPIVAVDAAGRSARRLVAVPADPSAVDVTLTFDSVTMLDVIDDATGDRLDDAVVDAVYDVGTLRLTPREDGLHAVGMPERVRALRIVHPEREAVALQPATQAQALANDAPPSRRDRVTVRMQASHRTTFRVVTPDGAPIPGVTIALSGKDVLRARRSHPELHGAWPTDSAHWNLRRQPRQHTLADAAGIATVALTPGSYTVDASLPPTLAGRRGVRERIVPSPWRIEVTGPAEHTVEISPPRLVSVRAVDARTDVGLARVRVTAAARGWSEGVMLAGPHAQVWIPGSVSTLEIDAPGYAPATLAAAAAVDGAVVRLSRGTDEPDGFARLVGALARRLIDQPVQFAAWRSEGGRRLQVWRQVVVVSDPDRVPFRIGPMAGPLEIQATVVGDLSWLRLESAAATWTPGAEITFSVLPPR